MKMEKFPGTLERKPGRNGSMAYELTAEQEAWLRRWFPEVENARLMKASGMSHSTLHRFARMLGLSKSEEGMKRIMHRQGIKSRRICERNGYYDTLRGRKPSEAAMEGTRRMWQEIREGRREHPMKAMKRIRPAQYKKCCRRMSENRKELVRRERRRDMLGISRQTSLNLPLNNYTRRQTSHRYSALKRGYILMADCSEQGGERWSIYYDRYTQRGRTFERNLEQDGFRVMPWKEDGQEAV